nr:MAG TPA: hypothetical protein [Caudoviricetes sp.]
MDKLIVRLLEDQTVMSAVSLLMTTAIGVGVAWLNHKRNQLIELSKGAKRSSIRSEYLNIYNSTEFTWKEKWDMTEPLVKQYFGELEGNHYIHGLNEKMRKRMEDELNENSN